MPTASPSHTTPLPACLQEEFSKLLARRFQPPHASPRNRLGGNRRAISTLQPLSKIKELSEKILAGQIRGRVVLDVNA